jgi:hypothetical protein
MFALKVRINDEQPIVAGAEDLVVLNAIVNCAGKLGVASHSPRPSAKQDFNFQLGGLTSRAPGIANEHVRWLERWDLKVGDRVTIEIIQADLADTIVSSTLARE